MQIPSNLIVNADDFGLNDAVNSAIIFCFRYGYINSASLLTNTPFFEETVNLVQNYPYINNIGVHINFVEGKPVSGFNLKNFLDDSGNWNAPQVNKKFMLLNSAEKQAFYTEIVAQIEKATSKGIEVTHLDSHGHIHTLPAFYSLFIKAACRYRLKLRIAQTYNEGNWFKFLYRQYINNRIKRNELHFSDYFENMTHFKNKKTTFRKAVTEIMLHPFFNEGQELSDHYDESTTRWIAYLQGL